MTKTQSFEVTPFQHNDPKYKCLCGTVHITMAAILIAVATIIVGIVAIVLAIVDDRPFYTWIPVAVVVLLMLVTSSLVLYAIKTEKEVFFLPYVGLMALSVLLSLGVAVLGIWSLVSPKSSVADFLVNPISNPRSNKEVIGKASVFLALAVLFLFCSIWFAFIMYRCFLYQKDVKIARHPHIAHYTRTKTGSA
uniref:MARVEL domain-containing protein n=1 Tax=Steinernema glaseri TaxID=37863 RepID=A0A1I7Z2L6_9BILA